MTRFTRLFRGRRPAGRRQNLWTRLRLEGLEDRTLLAAGALDPTFGTGGQTTVPFNLPGSNSLDRAQAVAIDAQGRILLAGFAHVGGTNYDFAVTRLLSDGSPDGSFGSGGKVTIGFDLGRTNDDRANSVAIDDQGRIVVAGYAEVSGDSNNYNFAVARLLSNGTLDTSFGGNGRVDITFNSPDTNSDDRAQRVAIDSQGRIVLAGSAQVTAGNHDFAVVRLTTAGALDTSFDTDGKATIAFNLTGGNLNDRASSFTFDSQGRIVVAGFAQASAAERNFAVARLTTAGALDTSFDGDGKATIDFNLGTSNLDDDEAQDVKVDDQGRIVLAGFAERAPASAGGVRFDFAVARLQGDGLPDATFSADGRLTIGFVDGDNDHRAFSVALAPQGRIVVAGHLLLESTGYDFGVLRLTSDGSLDTTFQNVGWVAYDFPRSASNPGDDDVVQAMALDAQGRIVVAGYTQLLANNYNFAVARLESDTLQFNPGAYTIAEDGGSIVLTVTRTSGTTGTVSVNYSTSNGSATAGSDYTASSGTLTFAAGVTTQTITIPILDDQLSESNETFTVTLSNPSAAGLGAQSTATVTITDNDSTPALLVNDVQVTEGDSGTVNAVFTVTLSLASTQMVTVAYATADGTATAGTDYQSATGTLTFNPGETSKTVTVAVNADLLDEADETFLINLTNPTNAPLARAQGVGTILDDDPTPTLSIDDVSVTEGDSGSVNAVFTVTLSAASGRAVTVSYATADGSATAPADYQGVTGTLTFNPGETSKTITVAVNADLLDEADETFAVNLTNPINATAGRGQGVGTIVDNDPTPSISINDVQVTEGDSGTVNAVFTVTLSAASGRAVTVSYATADGSATAPADYQGVTGTLTFNPGETSKTITVAVNADLLDEADETFAVNLTSPANATLSRAQGVGTIVDNDPTPSISVSDVQVAEGDSGTVNAVFTVTLSAASGQAVTVAYATADGTANAPADYQAASGTLTFNPGETSKTITVAVNADLLDEADETFVFNLTSPTNATLSRGQGVGTILDNDPTPTLSVSDVSVKEGNTINTQVSFTVALSAPSGRVVTVAYASADGTAASPTDYQAVSGTLTFNPGETTKIVVVRVNGDMLSEPSETFLLNLSSPTNATLARGQGTGTIVNDDPAVRLSIPTDLTGGLGATVSVPITLEVIDPAGISLAGVEVAISYDPTRFSVANPQLGTLIPGFTTSFNTASAGELRLTAIAPTGTGPTLAGGATGTLFLVDLTVLANAAFGPSSLNLRATLGGTATALFGNDFDPHTLGPAPTDNANDPVDGLFTVTGAGQLQFSAATYSAAENAGSATITVTRTGDTTGTVTVQYATSTGTATPGQDYTPVSGTLTFAPGETSKTFTVAISDDAALEPNETILLTLGGQATAVLTIIENDRDPGLLLNEIDANPPGTDQPFEYIEVRGTAGATLANVYIVAVEGDQAEGLGTADLVVDLSAAAVGTSGLVVIKSPTGGFSLPAGTTLVDSAALAAGGAGLEDGSISFLLLLSPTALAQDTDLDTNDDGVLDLPAGAVLIDTVGWTDGGTEDRVYGGVSLTQSAGTPGAAVRFTDHSSARSAFAWFNGSLAGTASDSVSFAAAAVSANFPAGGQLTPGAANSSAAPPLRVVSFSPTTTGFSIQFNRPLVTAALNLYDEGGALGPADVTLVGAATGAVRGSLVVDGTAGTVTFIRTGGVLAADSYTLTLRSAANGFRDPSNLLDGNGDGTAGDSYTTTFTVTAPPANAVVASLADIVRGYGQAVSTDLTLSNGQGVTGLDLTLRYDPALLTLTGFSPAAALAGATVQFNVLSPGSAVLTVSSATPLSTTAGPLTLGAFTGSVPATAPYGAKQVLRMASLGIFGGSLQSLPSRGDDALHIAAFVGDVNASRTYQALDAIQLQRVIAGQNSGFAAYPLADPVLLGDVMVDGQLQANDVSALLQLAVGMAVPGVPALPAGVTPPPAAGPDPRLYIPANLAGVPGSTVTVPVLLEVTDPAGISLAGIDVALSYDATRLAVGGVRAGSLIPGFALSWSADTPGELRLSAFRSNGPALVHGTAGSLFLVDFLVLPGAAAGSSALNLRAGLGGTATAVYDNELRTLTLAPAPTDAATDAVDGLFTVLAEPAEPSRDADLHTSSILPDREPDLAALAGLLAAASDAPGPAFGGPQATPAAAAIDDFFRLYASAGDIAARLAASLAPLHRGAAWAPASTAFPMDADGDNALGLPDLLDLEG